MTMTESEIVSVINQWESGVSYPRTLLLSESNGRVLQQAVFQHVQKYKSLSVADLDALVSANKDRLQFNVPPPVVVDPNAPPPMPHPDIMPQVKTMADVRNLSASETSRLMRLHSSKFSDRLAWIRDNRIVGEPTSVSVVPDSPVVAANKAQIAEARALVANLKRSDFGGGTSASGKMGQLQTTQNRLNAAINQMVTQRKSGAQILASVRAAIESATTSSIR